MARTNFKFAKRQKELERKKKKEEKQLRKLEKKGATAGTEAGELPPDSSEETPESPA